MLKMVIGHSEDIDSTDAIAEVIEQCRSQLGAEIPKAGILYAAIDHEFQTLVDGLNAAFPGIALIGCTTDGELSSERGFTEDGVVLTLFASDTINFHAGVAKEISKNPGEIIHESIQANLANIEAPKLCFMTSSSLTTSSDGVVTEMRKALGEHCTLIGGNAGDQWRFEKSYQFFNHEVLSDAIPYLLVSGPILFSHSVSSGWQPIGKPARATSVGSGTIKRIGDETAAAFYERYLGQNLDTLGEYPLAVFDDEAFKTFYLRSPILGENTDGSLTMVGDIPADAWVQITHATRDNVIEAASDSVTHALSSYPGTTPSGILCVSCAGRKMLLGTRTQEEVQLLRDAVPGIPVGGFYAYGEIAPLERGGATRLHNETFVSLVIGDI
ncbi:MAG: FIST C-terminal domain-containing protein [Candidatus Marinimicrobia bacterium]|nr:FIST C-terminal domain-containing protein [Candidatus Neomarinimicrobiota bacterium]